MPIQRSLKSWLCGILIMTFTCISVFAVGTQPSFAFSRADVNQLTATKICRECDLSNTDLRDADLSLANLSNANLLLADLSNIDLSNIDPSKLRPSGLIDAKTLADFEEQMFKAAGKKENELLRNSLRNSQTHAGGRVSLNSGYLGDRLFYEKVCIDETRGSLFGTYCRVPDGGCRNPGPLSPGEYLVNCICRDKNSQLYKPTSFPSVSEFKARCNPAP